MGDVNADVLASGDHWNRSTSRRVHRLVVLTTLISTWALPGTVALKNWLVRCAGSTCADLTSRWCRMTASVRMHSR